MRVKKPWNTNSLPHSWLPRSCWELLRCERELRNAADTYCGSIKTDNYRVLRKLSHVCRRPAAQKSHITRNYIASCAVKLCVQNVLTGIIICYKIYFITVVYANHKIFLKFPATVFPLYGRVKLGVDNNILFPLVVQDYVNYEEQKIMQLLDLGPPGAGYGHAETLVLGKSNEIYSYYE